MSLSETSSFQKIGSSARDWRCFAVLLFALPAAGCFQPLYGEAVHPGLTAEMQAIAIEPIKDRIGHYLGDDLSATLNGTGATPEPKYRLTVIIAETSTTPTVTSQLQVANAATVSVIATYTLQPAGGADAVLTGAANSAAVYDRTEDRFANLRAQRDAEIRIAKSLASEIELRLAAYLGEKK
jgi:LPS-assembly lipoprotein